MVNPLPDWMWENFLTYTNTGLVSGGFMFMSVAGNYYLWKSLEEYKKTAKSYEMVFSIIEPILTKLINRFAIIR